MDSELRPSVDTLAARHHLKGVVLEQLGNHEGPVRDEALQLIDRLTLLGPTSKEVLWEKYLTQLVQTSPYQKRLTGELAVRIQDQLSASTDARDMFHHAIRRAIVRGPDLAKVIFYNGKIPTSSKDYEDALDAFFDIDDMGHSELINLLTDVHGGIQKGVVPVDSSFVIVRQTENKKIAFGARIESQQLVEVGIAEIEAPCRVGAFDSIISSPDIVDLGNDMRMFKIAQSYHDYPYHFYNPYILPDGLFLLKSSSSERWGVISLEESPIATAISERLQSLPAAVAPK